MLKRSQFLTRPVIAAMLITIVAQSALGAEDAYYSIPVSKLEITAGKLPTRDPDDRWDWRWRGVSTPPRVVLDVPGEGYYVSSFSGPIAIPASSVGSGSDDTIGNPLVVRAPAGKDVTGTLYLSAEGIRKVEKVSFRIPAKESKPEHRQQFLREKGNYYQNLRDANIAGTAWFRYQARLAENAMGANRAPPTGVPAIGRFANDRDFSTTFDLFTGGRAIGENLQLDRALAVNDKDNTPFDIDKIDGITVAEIDWTNLLKGKNPKLDPLAASIPADQHVVFFPTFTALVQVADEAEKNGTPVLRMAEPRAEDAKTVDRYQQQLCMSLGGLGRTFGPHVVRSVALTGSDLNFRTGTDIAVLFEAVDPATLEQMLIAKVKLATMGKKDVAVGEDTAGGLPYKSWRSKDRSVSCYIARLGNSVVVSNSPYQIERLGAVAQKKTPNLASLPEYKFFRDRYPLGDADETAMAFLSDATIRRWCGPRWRIASSRQVRELAVIAQLDATYLDKIVTDKVEAGPVHTDLTIGTVSDYRLGAEGIHSPSIGSLSFLTPIAEIPLEQVTRGEMLAYQRWRDTYQSNWRWAFDPIALRLTVKPEKLAADLSVMPLIWESDYREFIELTQGTELKPDAGDPHGALVQAILAIGPKSRLREQGSGLLTMMVPGAGLKPLSWLGESVSVYADDDPIWEKLAKADPEQLESDASLLQKLPVALRADVSDPLKVALLLTGLRGVMEQTAPGMLNWDTLQHNEMHYVRLSAKRRLGGGLDGLEIFYATSPDNLTITINESLIKRVLDRQAARAKGEQGDKRDAEKSADSGQVTQLPWLGKSMALHVDRKLLDLVSSLSRTERQREIQTLAWSNLPILNEWKRLYPDRDPVELHEQVWKVKLVCPGGGKYVWNADWNTMESTVYGHPGGPIVGPLLTPAMLGLESADFGVTFEEQGLRARAVFERTGEAAGEKPVSKSEVSTKK
ncbi:MAG: hypothetical protein SGJ20_04525 [Planctomycetota bacterium]|nr:hypothetical protein [Planctomycetota bacterium]